MNRALSFSYGLVAFVLIISPSLWADQKVSVSAMAPVVVKTSPQAGKQNVDPNLKEIRVLFSKKMQDKNWSWVYESKDTFPQMTGDPRFLSDQKTCVLPVKLLPNKTYVIWINSKQFYNFKDKKGNPAHPYQLVFKTK